MAGHVPTFTFSVHPSSFIVSASSFILHPFPLSFPRHVHVRLDYRPAVDEKMMGEVDISRIIQRRIAREVREDFLRHSPHGIRFNGAK